MLRRIQEGTIFSLILVPIISGLRGILPLIPLKFHLSKGGIRGLLTIGKIKPLKDNSLLYFIIYETD